MRNIQYFDIHSHLNDPRFDADLDATLLRMREANVASIVVGTDHTMSERAIALAEVHPDIWATIGVHPTDNHTEIFDDAYYTKLAAHPRVVAIGECGLDYYWPAQNLQNQRIASPAAVGALEQDKSSSSLQHSSLPSRTASDFASFVIQSMEDEKKRQRELFEKQIAIALELKKPLMIHGRPTKGTMDAYEDIISILKKHPGIRGNVHFFVGNIAIAKQFCELGFTMSFTGVLTFTHEYDEVVEFLPLESIMSETDAPYVAPAPYRGKRNEPAYVVETVTQLARIRNEREEVIAPALLRNAERLFGI